MAQLLDSKAVNIAKVKLSFAKINRGFSAARKHCWLAGNYCQSYLQQIAKALGFPARGGNTLTELAKQAKLYIGFAVATGGIAPHSYGSAPLPLKPTK